MGALCEEWCVCILGKIALILLLSRHHREHFHHRQLNSNRPMTSSHICRAPPAESKPQMSDEGLCRLYV